MPLERDPEAREPQHLQDYLPLAGAHVLEIGAGEGRLTWRYARGARRVTGIDLDPERLDVAARDCPPELRPAVAFALAQAETMPFPAESFDHAVLAWSL